MRRDLLLLGRLMVDNEIESSQFCPMFLASAMLPDFGSVSPFQHFAACRAPQRVPLAFCIPGVYLQTVHFHELAFRHFTFNSIILWFVTCVIVGTKLLFDLLLLLLHRLQRLQDCILLVCLGSCLCTDQMLLTLVPDKVHKGLETVCSEFARWQQGHTGFALMGPLSILHHLEKICPLAILCTSTLRFPQSSQEKESRGLKS